MAASAAAQATHCTKQRPLRAFVSSFTNTAGVLYVRTPCSALAQRLCTRVRAGVRACAPRPRAVRARSAARPEDMASPVDGALFDGTTHRQPKMGGSQGKSTQHRRGRARSCRRRRRPRRDAGLPPPPPAAATRRDCSHARLLLAAAFHGRVTRVTPRCAPAAAPGVRASTPERFRTC